MKWLEKIRKNKIVFNFMNVVQALNGNKNKAKVYLSRSLSKGLIYHVKKGIYSFVDDPILYSTHIYAPSYISFCTGLYLHEMLEQIPTKIQVVSPNKNASNLKDVEFIYLPKRFMFGFEKERYHKDYILLAEKEKIALDMTYKINECPLGILKEIIPKLNITKLKKYVGKIDKNIVYKRMGYLLELNGYKAKWERKISGTNYFYPNAKKYIKKWKLYV